MSLRTAGRLLLLPALAIAALAGCSSDQATQPPAVVGPPLLMAFSSDRPPSVPFVNDIYFADLQTGDAPFPARNVNTTSDEGPATLSGNGAKMAFSSSRLLLGSLSGFAVQDIATGALSLPIRTRQLNGPINPSLSFDGRYLAVNYQLGGDPFAQVIACEDLAADTLLPLPSINEIGVTNFDPSLNADATLIAFASNGSRSIGAFDIVLYSVTDDDFIDLPGLNSTQQDLGPVISSDGRYIVFQSGRGGGAGGIDVYLYDRQVGSLVALPGLNTEFAEVQPFLSPDGRYIACMTESEGGQDIILYDVQAKARVPIPQINDRRFYDQYPVLAHLPASIAH